MAGGPLQVSITPHLATLTLDQTLPMGGHLFPQVLVRKTAYHGDFGWGGFGPFFSLGWGADQHPQETPGASMVRWGQAPSWTARCPAGARQLTTANWTLVN